MNTKTLFKTDDVEVQQSSKGAISFGYSDATAAMFDLYGRITELEEQLNECSEYLEGTESPADGIERKHYNEHRLMKRHAELAMKCDQLEAQNEYQRDVLSEIYCGDDKESHDLMELAREALGRFPAVSLAEHDAQVIENLLSHMEKQKGGLKYDGINWASMTKIWMYAQEIRQRAQEAACE